MQSIRFFLFWREAASLAALLASAAAVRAQHDYMEGLYDRMHHSPLQAKFEKIAPMPIGSVYVMRPGETEEDIRWHFRTMKELGYTNLKQLMTTPEWSEEEVQLIALEEGIIPWWHGQGGWAPIDKELLESLGIPKDASIKEIRRDPRMVERQFKIMRERVLKAARRKREQPDRPPLKGSSTAFDPLIGGRGLELTEEGERLFVQWARRQYGGIERLNKAYNQHHAGLNVGDEAAPGFASWEDFERNWKELSSKEYRHLRDILRFKADHNLKNIRENAKKFASVYPHAPYRGGGELGLFLPQAWYGVDLEGIAEIMTDFGTFYPSMHFSWHFSLVDHEVLRPTYMQASYAVDIYKGAWAAAWEATGGPQYFSGSGHGFRADDRTLTQFLFNHVAAGFKGFGLWAWSARTAGWEAGEYSLLGRHNEITPRARKVGQIGRALRRHREELWKARKEPWVGVYADWDNEAAWTAISIRGDDRFRATPIKARVGVSRALINGDVPFEYVTDEDLRKGLAPRYRVIYLPAALMIEDDVMEILSRYVHGGGRLAMDMPGAWYDEYLALFETDRGTTFEKTFGATIRDYQKADSNRPNSVDLPESPFDLPLNGVTAVLSPTDAKALCRFSETEEPAATAHRFGKGSAVLLAYEASLMCFEPGNERAERTLRQLALGDYEPPFHSQEAIVYRLAAPKADHYFLINDHRLQKEARLDFKDFQYRSAMDPVSQEPHEVGEPILLPAQSGRWLRFERRDVE